MKRKRRQEEERRRQERELKDEAIEREQQASIERKRNDCHS